MKHQARSAAVPSRRIATAARRAVLLPVRGTGARPFTLVLFSSLLSIAALLAVTASAAIAAPPSPRIFAGGTTTTATTAKLEGTPELNGPTEEPGTYQFLYKATETESSAECESAGAGKAPVPPGHYPGLEFFEVFEQEVTGLTPATKYVACLFAENANGEKAISEAASFETAPPTPETGQASEFTATSAKLEGALKPAGTKLEYDFIYNPGASCTGGSSTPFAEGEDTVSTVVSGLAPATTYTFCLVARGPGGETVGQGVSFTTLTAPPAVLEEFATKVSATSATLNATLDPSGLSTAYRFEYGTTEAYDSVVPIPSGAAGSGNLGILVSSIAEGLLPATTYHYRVVAENALAQGLTAVFGPDRQFTTQSGGASVLPDGRSWELVSPVDKNGAPLEGMTIEGGVIQAAADGSALTYIARDPVTSDPAGNRSFAEDQLFASRGAGGGWITQDIATPHESPAGLVAGELSEYRLFSPDLSSGVVQPANFTPLAPTATERTPYLREQNGEYLPLVTEANVPPGTKFGTEEVEGHVRNGTGVEFVAASPDLSHVVLSAPQSLTPGFETGGNQALYEWSAGNLAPVSILPGGGSASLEFAAPAFLGQNNEMVRNAISQNGNRVIFSAGSNGSLNLYLRDLDREETLQLDAAETGCISCESGGAIFQDASVDGSRVFFTDSRALTADSTVTEGKPDLYVCEVEVEGEHLSCALTDLTSETVGEPAQVKGTVLGTSEDGSSVYFVANGVLAPGAVPGDCPEQRGGSDTQSCNLYRYDAATETTQLVAIVSAQDYPDWDPSEGQPNHLGNLTARVSPNGRFLAFMSERSLTGYDNRDANSGQLDEEVYLYDSAADKLVCASCDPSGARPLGEFEPQLEEKGSYPLFDGVGNWQRRWVAASIPGWTPASLLTSLYQSRYLSDQGRLFFNSPVGLAPKDSNGTQDVYEYEPTGIGSCTTATAGFTEGADGCVELISGGTSARESVFLDASESGNDVFFLTTSKLAPQDVDSALDAYDAHVCTTAVPCPPPASPPPPACEGDACQLPATPPNDATPGSLTFQGAGNLLECPKGTAKKSGKCVKKSKTKKSHKKSHKKQKRAAGHDRGGHK